MTIKIRYFASLKDTIGRAEEAVDNVSKVSIKDLWQLLNPTISMPNNILIAVNMEYVPLTTIVVDGDEVAFFPPVTGG